jgi:hypothetical protein
VLLSRAASVSQWSDFFYNQLEKQIQGIQSIDKMQSFEQLELFNGQIVVLMHSPEFDEHLKKK